MLELFIQFHQISQSMKLSLIILALSVLSGLTVTVPSWQKLECQVALSFKLLITGTFSQEGHKYLFSDVSHSWSDALSECYLYGGSLVTIENIWEQNCLLRYAQSQGYDEWYWTDGNSKS